VDETHVTQNGGDQVFRADKEAIQKLRALGQGKQSPLADATLAGFIQRLARADRLLAVVALGEAGTGGANPQKFDEAWRKVIQGDQAIAQGQYVGGIEHYAIAWKHALDRNR
jgi:hypothetical protein